MQRRFTFDPQKDAANKAKHGLALDDARDLSWESAVINDARPDRFGKPRMYALGMYRQKVHVVIFAYLGNEAISVISFRRADEQERNMYYDRTQT
jgi:uncharacterized DUF497 family protein